MPTTPAFNEDFFERVIDVQWIEEKKCYFMAGNSQQATYNYNSNYYTSDDGMHWTAHAGGSGGSGLYGYTCGLWMRENFKPDGKPIWILGGEGVDTDRRAAGIQISRDGQSSSDIQFLDDGQSGLGWYASQFFVDVKSDPAKPGFPPWLEARLETATFADYHTYTSRDGLSWSGGSRSRSSLALPPARSITPAFELPSDFDVAASHSMSIDGKRQPADMRMLGSATPFQTTSKVKSTNDLYQLSNRSKAIGLLRQGKYAGKRVQIEGGRSHGFHGPGTPGADYFDPICTVTDALTGRVLNKKSNCGMKFVHSIAYGYFVFVAAGGNSTDTSANSVLSHTTDGVHWHPQQLGEDAHTMWPLVVGPRPGL